MAYIKINYKGRKRQYAWITLRQLLRYYFICKYLEVQNCELTTSIISTKCTIDGVHVKRVRDKLDFMESMKWVQSRSKRVQNKWRPNCILWKLKTHGKVNGKNFIRTVESNYQKEIEEYKKKGVI